MRVSASPAIHYGNRDLSRHDVLWVWILTHFTLSRSYPVTALAYVLVPLSGWFFFGETLDLKFGLGVVLICAGIVLTVRT